jgi:hypothetical protein
MTMRDHFLQDTSQTSMLALTVSLPFILLQQLIVQALLVYGPPIHFLDALTPLTALNAHFLNSHSPHYDFYQLKKSQLLASYHY